MHIEFITREGPPSPYTGEFQFQYMSPEEANVYVQILSGSFKDVFNKENLEKKAANRVSNLIHNK
jgi:hypothetical protein